MAGRKKPSLRRRPAGKGKPGVPYIPTFPAKPDAGEGKWFWHYEKGEWVDTDPYPDQKGSRGR